MSVQIGDRVEITVHLTAMGKRTDRRDVRTTRQRLRGRVVWSLELYQQANRRLHRQGQTERVIVHHLVAKGTIDEDVVARLTKKAATQDELVQALKARIERIWRETAVCA